VVELFQAHRIAGQDVLSAQSMLSDPEMKGWPRPRVREGKQRLIDIEAELQRRLL
jgi:hypothetical protein